MLTKKHLDGLRPACRSMSLQDGSPVKGGLPSVIVEKVNCQRVTSFLSISSAQDLYSPYLSLCAPIPNVCVMDLYHISSTSQSFDSVFDSAILRSGCMHMCYVESFRLLLLILEHKTVADSIICRFFYSPQFV